MKDVSSATTNATCEIAPGEAVAPGGMHWRSPLLALLWKEWRQQRWVFLALALLPLLLLALSWRGSGLDIELPWTLCLWVAFTAPPVVLTANAFAGEWDDGTDAFLATLALSRRTILWSKYGLCVCLSALAFFLFIAFSFCLPGVHELLERHLVGLFMAMALGPLLFSSATAAIASTGPGSVFSVLAGVLAGGCVVLWFGLCVSLYQVFGGGGGDGGALVLHVGPAVVLAVLAGSSVLWVRCRGASATKRIVSALALGAFVVVVAAVPAVWQGWQVNFVMGPVAAGLLVLVLLGALIGATCLWTRFGRCTELWTVASLSLGLTYCMCVLAALLCGYLYTVFLVTPSDYYRRTARLVRAEPFPSQSGHHVALSCLHPWQATPVLPPLVDGTRVALVSVSDGEWSWLNPLHVNGLHYDFGAPAWSPDGKKLLISKVPVLPHLLTQLGPQGWVGRSADLASLHVVEPDTGAALELPLSLRNADWFNAHVVFGELGSHVAFHDLKSQTTRLCSMPRRATAEGGRSSYKHYDVRHPRLVTDRGVLGWRVAYDVRHSRLATDRGESGWPFAYHARDLTPITERGVPGRRAAGDRGSDIALLSVALFRPSLREAEEIAEFRNKWGRYARPAAVSADGTWLAITDRQRDYPHSRTVYIASMKEHTLSRLTLPSGQEACGRPEFLANQQKLVFLTRRGVAVYELDEDEWQLITPVDTLTGWDSRFSPRDKPVGNRLRISPEGAYGAVVLRPWRNSWQFYCGVVDFASGEHWAIWREEDGLPSSMSWLGEGRLLVQTRENLWTVNRDGTSKRRLLPRK